ncbi:putative phage-associated protein [Serratia fonticola]|uniref:Putative phage-associated protein n=1 Tax=Serratia fonticola TaxID=47917 RepID=A0A542BL86_SERFO|nr:Panacea domain-containing protein [Serratia fonticola]TQI79333.1 putative phage-associated protein [Serratia fonticola]TQI98642.1 putative phage-associated protein [Serratia fonticola]TVZ68169.1 putative phage-associated protein [Serratia fonticola]HBE9090501.1 SocA family protein [Serratia fonticola]
MFSESKTAQMAGYLLLKRGGRMAYIKLMKLLYLSDREYMLTYGDSMTGDRAVSMDNGPVLSKTYDLLKSGSPEEESPWGEWIAGERNFEVSIKKQVRGLNDEDAFDELSKADIRILDKVFAEFGKYKRFDLCEHTHKMCPEWQDPHGSSVPINPKAIFMAGGKTEEEAEMLIERMRERGFIQQFSAQLS